MLPHSSTLGHSSIWDLKYPFSKISPIMKMPPWIIWSSQGCQICLHLNKFCNNIHIFYHLINLWIFIIFCLPVISCPDDFVYDPCGSPCPRSCGDDAIQGNCTEENCIETCRCPEGQILDGNRCVEPDGCGCSLDNGLYLPVSYVDR